MNLRKGSLAWMFQPICLPLLAGSFVRIWNFWTPGLWLDEFATQWAAGAPTLAICWQRSIHYLANSPFYFLIVRGPLLLFGESEFALRLPSVLAGIAAIYLAYLLGRELFSDETALMAAWCLALHPWFIDQSQNARVYSLAVCFALMASLAFSRSFDSARSRDVWFYVVASAGLIYLQFLFALFVVFQSIFWIWLVMKCKQGAGMMP
ncbi:MAG: glycosyltransferase family 39 protein [Terriglobia bacterium]